MHTTQIKHIQ